jgi:uridylate kinase
MSYKRVIIKFSGEILKSADELCTIDHSTVKKLCDVLNNLHDTGIEIGVVLGGGNIFRGLPASVALGYDRVHGDHMGMLATLINCLAVQDRLEKLSLEAKIYSAFAVPNICDTFSVRDALKDISDGNILLLAGGTGNAFFSTDSAAALRASELKADIIIKATKVDGVYDRDPKRFKDAKKFEKISFLDALERRLDVMDSTAFTLCMDNNIPVLVLDAISDMGNIKRALFGDKLGTLIGNFNVAR